MQAQDPDADHPPLARLWLELQTHYHEPALHDAFIEACARSQCLNFASSRYRERMEQEPGDPVAGRRLGEIAARALQGVRAAADHYPEAPTLQQRLFRYELALAVSAISFIAVASLALRLLPQREVGVCGGLLKASPVCLAADIAFALRHSLAYSLPAAIAAFLGTLWLLRRLRL